MSDLVDYSALGHWPHFKSLVHRNRAIAFWPSECSFTFNSQDRLGIISLDYSDTNPRVPSEVRLLHHPRVAFREIRKLLLNDQESALDLDAHQTAFGFMSM